MEHFVRSGLTFEVTDSGDPAAPAIVLLHGFPQDPTAFDGVVPQLNQGGYRTLVPSQRGYTAAARPRGRRAYRTTEIAADVMALLDAAGVQKAHLVGHDWGGAPAWALAAWSPDRVASCTVLSTPHPRAMLASLVTSSQGLKSWYMAAFQLPAVPERLTTPDKLAQTLRDSRLPEPYVQRYCEAMADRTALTGALNWYRGLPFSVYPPVGVVRVPTTYVWGRYDFALGRAAAERTARYVDAPYRFVELDSGHWLPEVEPEAVAQAVLERVRSTSD